MTTYMSRYQDLARCLLAAGSAPAADGKSTYYLYTDGSSLISKQWNGKSFASPTSVADSVRPNSVAAYVLTPTIELVVYVSSSSELRAIQFDDESDEWLDATGKTARHRVHPHGKVAVCLDKDGRAIVFFQNHRSQLVTFYLDDGAATVVPVRLLDGSPLCASFVKGTLHFFYISADDRCMHCITRTNGSWNNRSSWRSKRAFEAIVKQFNVTPNLRGDAVEFEAYVLTEEGRLLQVTVEGELRMLGRVDGTGMFISERPIDLCCIDAQNNTLTEERLERYLAEDSSVIDAVGGPIPATPLATACCKGNLDDACLLLDNPFRLADPNALSPGNRTPLYFAICRSPANQKELVSALLDAGAHIDDCYAEDDFNTPLMNAILRDFKDVIHELIDRGASLTKKNGQGQTAVMLAEGTELASELKPLKERQLQQAGPPSVQKELINVLVAIAMLIIAYFNNDVVRDVVSRAVAKLQEMNEGNNEEEEEEE